VGRTIGTPMRRQTAVRAFRGLLDWLTADEARLYVSEYFAPMRIGRKMIEDAVARYPQCADYLDQAAYLIESRICRRLTSGEMTKPVAEMLLDFLCGWHHEAGTGGVTVNVSQAQAQLPSPDDHERAMQRIAAVYQANPEAPPRQVPSAEREGQGIDKSFPTCASSRNPLPLRALPSSSGEPESRTPLGGGTVGSGEKLEGDHLG